MARKAADLRLLLLCAATLALILGPGARPGAGEETPSAGPGYRETLLRNNFFLRDRGRAKPVLPPPADPPPIIRDLPRPAPVYRVKAILTGVAGDPSGYIAFFENPETRRVTSARQGQGFLHGKISGLAPDRAWYTEDGRTRVIMIGETVEFVSSRPFPEAGAEPLFIGVTPHPSAPAPDRQALIEQMRRRRLEEIGGSIPVETRPGE